MPARAGGRTATGSRFLNDALIQETGTLPTAEQSDEVLRRRPDVLVLASSRSDTFQAVYPVDRVLREDPRAAAYRPVFVASGTAPTCRFHLSACQR